jgi:ribosomal protein L4
VNERVAAARKKERDRADEQVSATRRRERANADARVARAKAARRPARRPGRPAHDYRNCRDHDCQRVACEAYREGVADGMDAAEEAQ